MVRTALAFGLIACSLPAAALDCPAMPQQASRDTEVEVRVGVRGLVNASGVELTTKTRELTNELLSKLPNADRVYLEQMLYASYCSALKANAALAESEREQRVRLYAREMRAAVAPAVPPAPRVDRRDAARAELTRLPVDYTADAFVAAAARGDMRVVNLFVAAGFDVNAADREQTTALAQSATRGDMPMLTTLLGAGARAGARVGRVDTALSWAAYGRQPAALRALLAAQPGTDAVKQAFRAAVRVGYLAGMELLRPNGVDLAADGVDALADTALLEREDNDPDPDHVAAAAKLVEWGVPVAGANEQGITLLMEAISRGRPALARFALQAGSPVDQRCECSGILEGGFTPLTYALTRNELSPIVEMLLARRADPNVRTRSGRTPLLVLLDSHPEPDLLQRLIAAGADVNAADQAGRTPLTAAAERGDLIPLLLAAGARVDTRSDGRTDSRLTPLMRAAYADAVDSIRLLLDAKVDIDARSGRGRTALMIAVLEGARDSAALLVQRGARADLRDEDGASALDHAATLPAGEERTRMLTALRKGAAP